jgi:hypothetical protein
MKQGGDNELWYRNFPLVLAFWDLVSRQEGYSFGWADPIYSLQKPRRLEAPTSTNEALDL